MSKITNADLLVQYLVAEQAESLIIDLVQEKGYYYDTENARYVSRWNGRPVKESTVRNAVEKYNNKFIQDNIDRSTERLISGDITLQEWQDKVADEIKQGHVINATVGKGGRAAMGQSDWGRVGRRLRDQYQYLNGFSQAIKAGTLTPGQIRVRMNMYVNAIRSSYYGGLTAAMKVAGRKMERRRTTSATPCGQCTAWEARGWQPIGTVPEPGIDCDGLTNCKCEKEYKK